MKEVDFKRIMQQAGIPTDSYSMQVKLESILENSDFVINNKSPMSPFWRLQKAMVTEPALDLINTLATQIMPNSFARLAKDEWLDLHGDARKLPRLTEVKVQGHITFSRADTTSALVIAAGTRIHSIPINGVVYTLVSLFDTEFSANESQVQVVVQAEFSGKNYNLSRGYYVYLEESIEGVSITNNDDWLIIAGQDVETNENYQLRFRDAFATLGSYHVDSLYRTIIATYTGISADNIVFDKTAPRGPGSVDVYLYLDVGQVSQALLDRVNDYIAAGNHGDGDDLKVFAVPLSSIDIDVNLLQHINTQDKRSDIEQFIRAAFRQNNDYQPTRCKPDALFSFSQLEAELHNNFPEIKSIKFANNNIAPSLSLPLPDKVTFL
ncbi:baseplate J/gp47 family protein [Shewanella surugensis]|uniref:Baseplate J/gp47 family protein n=1 Tax=Shewanella surugensis TaxID=212020 RepID=A0ABT0L6I3_9GAMM|nr:baseplate J/gp47 family protein [Shewanella surugensis]MCL1123299.1 baseplate J/gp47 family protein [Shewanella surugensis]